MKFETYISPKNRQHYFRIRARNGKVIAQSEGYSRRRSADRAIETIILGSPSAKRVRR